MRVTLQVLVELKAVFKADAGLELNVSKTSILPKGVTAQATFDIADHHESNPNSGSPQYDVLLDSF